MSNYLPPLSEFHPAVKNWGSTAQRPASPINGQPYFDRNIGQNIYWNTTGFSGPAANWYKTMPSVADAASTKATDATTPGKLQSGDSWIPQDTRTWGVLNGSGIYDVSDVSGDTLKVNSFIPNPTIQFSFSGDATSGAVYRFYNLIFSGKEDLSEYYMLQLYNQTFNLYKFAAAAFTLLQTNAFTHVSGTYYTLTAQCIERKIYTYVGGVAQFAGVPYTVPVADNRFLGYTWCGVSLGKGGAPATSAYFKDFKVRWQVD